MDVPNALRLFERAASVVSLGQPCALATVVGVQGSAYRHEGARMLILADGTVLGAISGGCLESDVAEAAREAIRTGHPKLLRYDMTSEDDDLWGLGLGCNGVVEVFIQPLLAGPGPQAPDDGSGPARQRLEAPAAGGAASCGR